MSDDDYVRLVLGGMEEALAESHRETTSLQQQLTEALALKEQAELSAGHFDRKCLQVEKKLEAADQRYAALRTQYDELAAATTPGWRDLSHQVIVGVAICNKQDA